MNKEIALSPGDKVLISRTDRLGDLILALPFVDTFKKRYPECKVDVITSLYASPILEGNKNINKILRVQNDQLLSNKLYKKDLLQKIKRENYKVVIVLYPERHISRLFYDIDIPHRIGTAGRFHSIFFNEHLLHSRKKNVKHESLYNQDFMAFFRKGETESIPKVYLKEKDIRNAKRILEEAGVKDTFIVLHPGSGGSAESWSYPKFMELYSELEKEGLVLVVSGSEAEGDLINESSKNLPFDIKKITGNTDLRTLAAVLSMAEVVVANSTGPLHLAAAVGTKVVGLYPSKKAMSPIRWGPLGENHTVLQPEGNDCDCPSGSCRCMEKINSKDVAREVIALMRK